MAKFRLAFIQRSQTQICQFLYYMASRYDKGKFKRFRKNYSDNNWKRKPRNRMDTKDRQHTRKDRAWRSKENDRHGRKKRYSNYKSNGFGKEDKNPRSENSEKNTKYGKRQNFKRREINQLETAKQDSERSDDENEYSSEQSDDTESNGSTSADETAEINCIEDTIATASETKGFSKPKGKRKLDTDPNVFSGKRRNNAIELELRTNLPYNSFKKSHVLAF